MYAFWDLFIWDVGNWGLAIILIEVEVITYTQALDLIQSRLLKKQ